MLNKIYEETLSKQREIIVSLQNETDSKNHMLMNMGHKHSQITDRMRKHIIDLEEYIGSKERSLHEMECKYNQFFNNVQKLMIERDKLHEKCHQELQLMKVTNSSLNHDMECLNKENRQLAKQLEESKALNDQQQKNFIEGIQKIMEEVARRLEEIRKEELRKGMLKVSKKKATPKKPVRRLVMLEFDEETVGEYLSKKTKAISEERPSRKRTHTESSVAEKGTVGPRGKKARTLVKGQKESTVAAQSRTVREARQKGKEDGRNVEEVVASIVASISESIPLESIPSPIRPIPEPQTQTRTPTQTTPIPQTEQPFQTQTQPLSPPSSIQPRPQTLTPSASPEPTPPSPLDFEPSPILTQTHTLSPSHGQSQPSSPSPIQDITEAPLPPSEYIYTVRKPSVLTKGIKTIEIPLQEEKKKNKDLSLEEIRAKSISSSSSGLARMRIYCDKLEYSPLTAEEMGSFLSILDELLINYIAEGLRLQNKFNVPPSMRIKATTTIKVKPDRIVPRVYLVDRNKDKFPKKHFNKGPMPTPIRFDKDWAKKSQDDIDMALLLFLSKTGQATEHDARTVWERYLRLCEQASSSGVSAADKAETPTVGSVTKKKEHQSYMFDDIFGAPTRSTQPIIELPPEPGDLVDSRDEEPRTTSTKAFVSREAVEDLVFLFGQYLKYLHSKKDLQ